CARISLLKSAYTGQPSGYKSFKAQSARSLATLGLILIHNQIIVPGLMFALVVCCLAFSIATCPIGSPTIVNLQKLHVYVTETIEPTKFALSYSKQKLS